MYKIFSTGLFETCFYLISIFGCPSNSQYWTFLSKFWKELDRDCFLCFHFLTLFSSSTLIGFALVAAVGWRAAPFQFQCFRRSLISILIFSKMKQSNWLRGIDKCVCGLPHSCVYCHSICAVYRAFKGGHCPEIYAHCTLMFLHPCQGVIGWKDYMHWGVIAYPIPSYQK